MCFISGFLKVLDIPRGARHLMIQEPITSSHILGITHTNYIYINIYIGACLYICIRYLRSTSVNNVYFSYIYSCEKRGIRTVFLEWGKWIPKITVGHWEGRRVGISEWQGQGNPSDHWSSQTWNSYHGKKQTIVLNLFINKHFYSTPNILN